MTEPTESQIKAAARAGYAAAYLKGSHSASSFDDAPKQVQDYWRSFIRAALVAAEAAAWRPIDEAPLDKDVLLGWWRTWPEREWRQEVGWAGASNTKPPGMSNAWLHGEATHFRPLPAGPGATNG